MSTSKVFRPFAIEVMNPRTKETVKRTLHGYNREDVVKAARKLMPDYSVCKSAQEVA